MLHSADGAVLPLAPHRAGRVYRRHWTPRGELGIVEGLLTGESDDVCVPGWPASRWPLRMKRCCLLLPCVGARS